MIVLHTFILRLFTKAGKSFKREHAKFVPPRADNILFKWTEACVRTLKSGRVKI